MQHSQQCEQVFASGIKGPALFVCPLSEGTWIDRMVMSAMAYKLFGRPAKTEAEVEQLSNYWLEHADDDVIYEFFETMPLVEETVKEADFLKFRDELAKKF